jgi:phospholipid/cholesterol/gamma-HCH transport system permease protein
VTAIDSSTDGPHDGGQGAWLRSVVQDRLLVLVAGGRWNMASAVRLQVDLETLQGPSGGVVELDAAEITGIDSTGAWLLYRTLKRLQSEGLDTRLVNASPTVAEMLDQMAANDVPHPAPERAENGLIRVVRHVGETTEEIYWEVIDGIAFLGLVMQTLAGTLLHPSRLRLTPLVFHMEKVGLNALPIVGLISFLIGVVLAYQGATQLQKFGAEVFVVDLIGVSVLREIGILLTAIVVAGRSGSAFTAQIGSMKVNEEVDAMRTLGLDPIQVLVIPRTLALVLMLPLLAFFSDIMGLLGGGLMAWSVLDVSPGQFIERLNGSIGMWTFWVGIIKAPVFGLLIALVGCYEGLQVANSAESVGSRTTRSVVESIFLVMIVDAVFSIFFAFIGI